MELFDYYVQVVIILVSGNVTVLSLDKLDLGILSNKPLGHIR